jgi:hypothetical protein
MVVFLSSIAVRFEPVDFAVIDHLPIMGARLQQPR